MNKVILFGRLGADPTPKIVNGSTVINVGLATSEKYKDKNGELKEITEWHNISAWGSVAEYIGKYGKKGDRVLVEGKISTRSYESNGETKKVTEIKAEKMDLISSTPKPKEENSQEKEANIFPQSSGFDDSSDLPF